MNTWWQTLLTWIIAIVLSFGAGFLTAWLVKKQRPQTIDLTEQQRQQVIQDARLGWITLDSAKAMIETQSKIHWVTRYKDSLIVKDSINIRDSVIYIPVYIARDTSVNFYYDTLGSIIDFDIGLRQRFYPLQEKFASDLWMKRFNLSVPEPETCSDGVFKNRFIVYIGYGVSGDAKSIGTGFQIGAGVRIW